MALRRTCGRRWEGWCCLLLCILLAGPVWLRAAEGFGGGRLQEALPGKMVLHLSTRGVTDLSRRLSRLLERINRGESTDPIGGAVGVEPEAREHPAEWEGTTLLRRLPMLMAVLCKIPVESIPKTTDLNGPAEVALYFDARDRVLGTVLLPITNFRYLVEVWQSDALLRELVRTDEEGITAMSDPRMGAFFFFPLGRQGTLVGRSVEAVRVGAVHYEHWSAPPISGDGDVRFIFEPQKLRKHVGALDRAWRLPRADYFGEGVFPRHARTLMHLPGAITDNGPVLLEELERVAVEVQLIDRGLEVALAARAVPGTALEKHWVSMPRTGEHELLSRMPVETVAFASFAHAECVSDLLSAVALSAALDRPADTAFSGPAAVRLAIRESMEIMRGTACACFVRGSLEELNLLVAFNTESAAVAEDFRQKVQPHLAGVGEARTQGAIVLVGVGIRHAALLTDLEEALGEEKVRFGLDEMGNADAFGLIGFYPVNVCKALMGELVVMLQLSGLPLQMRRLVESTHAKYPDSPTPCLAWGSVVNFRLEGRGIVPLGAAMDVARLLNGYAVLFDTVNQNAAHHYANQWMAGLQAELFKDLIPLIDEIERRGLSRDSLQGTDAGGGPAAGGSDRQP